MCCLSDCPVSAGTAWTAGSMRSRENALEALLILQDRVHVVVQLLLLEGETHQRAGSAHTRQQLSTVVKRTRLARMSPLLPGSRPSLILAPPRDLYCALVGEAYLGQARHEGNVLCQGRQLGVL